MSTDLSPTNELFIQEAIVRGEFHNREEALNEAVEMLKRRHDLLDHIDEGTRQLRAGEYTEYDREGLRRFFDEVKRAGRERLQEQRRSS